jgi:hypothetical protein
MTDVVTGMGGLLTTDLLLRYRNMIQAGYPIINNR